MITTQLLAFLGGQEIIILAIIIIVLFGAKKIPKLARSIGQASGELKKGRLESEKELKAATEEPPKDTDSKE
ncbi:twin-arginine translocase TatA/TatE family subunit [Verrucomicrobia bacterium]|jgi:sec-independent protein translocase protein TatA|nr:twin-arginine translocase TatA/TatE family subunit [Verrucomicrobiota bacterium]NCG28505.1 twin-arginine translocase TatA/TatE family subunit [Verrucomicrobiales bacterium]|tara:strand:- start:86 stop:301 length:216 start_codon:yes stop_codon:yes gene_type:complete